MKGPDKTRGRGDHDAERGHGQDQEGGHKGQGKSQGLLDQVNLIEGREPQEAGVGYGLSPPEGGFQRDQSQTEFPDNIHDPGSEMIREKEKDPFQEPQERFGLIFETDETDDQKEIGREQEEPGAAKACG